MSQSLLGAASGGLDGKPRVSRAVLGAISVCHLLNDTMQSLLAGIYPLLRGSFHLSFGQIGLLSFAFLITASVLQPIVGHYADRRRLPWSLAAGMGFSMSGLLLLGFAGSYPGLLAGAGLLGVGSSIFHPEASRIARLASGGRHGLAQSVFQVGGNFGASFGPLLAAFVVLPHGRFSLAWFCLLALAGMILLGAVGRWYAAQPVPAPSGHARATGHGLPEGRVRLTLGILVALVFSKNFYLASLSSYYVFYLMHRFGLSARQAQIDLFLFLASAAVGTFAGGPIGDAVGRKTVIRASILGVLPFSLLLPWAGLQATVLLSLGIGLVLASAFPAIVVYANELLPGRIGMVSGLFFGLAFGFGGLGAAALGVLADHIGIVEVFRICGWLPAIGLLALYLPDPRSRQGRPQDPRLPEVRTRAHANP